MASHLYDEKCAPDFGIYLLVIRVDDRGVPSLRCS